MQNSQRTTDIQVRGIFVPSQIVTENLDALYAQLHISADFVCALIFTMCS